MARKKPLSEEYVGKRAMGVFKTQDAVRELIASGMSTMSPAYRKLRSALKKITGKSNVLTTDPLDYSNKSHKKQGKVQESQREQVYKAYEKFAKSVTSSSEGIIGVQERNLETARRLLGGVYGYDSETGAQIKGGLATGTEQKLLDLIKKAREEIGDTVFNQNSDFIVNTLVTAVLSQEETGPLTYEEFLERPESKNKLTTSQRSRRLIEELKAILPQIKDEDLKKEILDVAYSPKNVSDDIKKKYGVTGEFEDSYEIGKKYGLYNH